MMLPSISRHSPRANRISDTKFGFDEPVSPTGTRSHEKRKSSLYSNGCSRSVDTAGRRLVARSSVPRQNFYFQYANSDLVVTWSVLQAKVYNLISRPWFDALVGIIILLNAAMIGVEVDMKGKYRFFRKVEIAFFSFFALELLLRIYVFRQFFLTSAINNADLVIVVLGCIAIVLDYNADEPEEAGVRSHLKNASFVRVARLLRLVRVLRVSTQFESLWMIVQGLMASISTILWTALLLLVVTYVFGVIAHDYVETDRELQMIVYDHEREDTVGDRCAGLGRTLLTILDFFALENLSSKGYDIITKRPFTIVYFLAFALTVPVVLLNLITAALVDMALRASASDQEHARALALAEWESRVDDLKKLFFKITLYEPDVSKEAATENTANEKEIGKLASVLKKRISCMGSAPSDQPMRKESSEVPKLTRDQLVSMGAMTEVREHLNLLFGEPRHTTNGMDRLMELWVVLDVDEDGEITLDEFTDGLGRLYDVIRNPNADAFVMLRLVKLHYSARQERLRAQELALRAQQIATEERKVMRREFVDRVDAIDKKLEVLFERQGLSPQVPLGMIKRPPAEHQCEVAPLRVSL